EGGVVAAVGARLRAGGPDQRAGRPGARRGADAALSVPRPARRARGGAAVDDLWGGGGGGRRPVVCDRGGPGPFVRPLLRLDTPRPPFPRPDRSPPAVLVLRAGPPAGDDAVDPAAALVCETPRRARAAGAAATDGGPRRVSPGGALVPGVLLGVGLQAPVVYLAGHAAAGAGAGLLCGRRLFLGPNPAGPLGLRRGRDLSSPGRGGPMAPSRVCREILVARPDCPPHRRVRRPGPGDVLPARLGRGEFLPAAERRPRVSAGSARGHGDGPGTAAPKSGGREVGRFAEIFSGYPAGVVGIRTLQ